MKGEVASTNALARREGVNHRHIARMLSLAWLAPDIVGAIARGDIPHTLSLARLKKAFPWTGKNSEKHSALPPDTPTSDYPISPSRTLPVQGLLCTIRVRVSGQKTLTTTTHLPELFDY
mgnify:CR=1 FL=1